MYYREVEILRAESIATAGTKTIDINLTDAISKLSVIIKKTNTNSTPIAHPGKIIKNILVCDGADVLFGMNGQDAQALAYFTENKQPASMINYVVGQWSMQIIEIKFGRFLYDELLALDPKRFNNLQIKIEHDLDLGGSTGTVADLSVYAHVFDEKVIEPAGYLYNKEIYSFLPVANAWKYIDLPTDFSIRAIMFGANECEDGPEYNLAELKLTEDQGKHILCQSLMERYLLQSSAYYDPWMEKVIVRTATTALVAFYASPHWERTYLCIPDGAAYATQAPSAAGCKYSVGNLTNGRVNDGWAQGHNPFGQTFIKTHGGDKLDDVWKIGVKGSGRLELKAGNTPDVDEYVRVHTQQIRTY